MESEKVINYQCSFCEYTCAQESRLESHIRKHTKERPFVCAECNRCFSSPSHLKLHIKWVHDGASKVQQNKKHKCSLCPYAARLKPALKSHMRRHTGDRRFPCEHANCGYAAKSSRELQLHRTYKHTKERPFFCQFPNCHYRGKTMKIVIQHSVTHSEDRPFVCDFEGCNFRAKRRSILTVHKRGVHNGGYKPFACSKCNFRTTSTKLLRNHELVHGKENSVKCNFRGCKYSCKSKERLKQHVLHVHTEKTFQCDFKRCLFRAASRPLLEIHKKCVHDHKVYKCPCCEFRGGYLPQLKKHIAQKHNVISCPKKGCPCAAKSHESLKYHHRHHEASSRSPVKGCSHTGTSSFGWKRHMKVHNTKTRPFRCPICPKNYPANSEFLKHLQSHTNEKPFKCYACNFGSATRAAIIRHVRIVHSNAFPQLFLDEESNCGHCGFHFGNAFGLTMHRIKLKTAVVVLTRLQIKFEA